MRSPSPARLLTEFVGSLQNERVDVKTTTQPHAMELSCGPQPGPHHRDRRRGVPADSHGRGGRRGQGVVTSAAGGHRAGGLRGGDRGVAAGADGCQDGD